MRWLYGIYKRQKESEVNTMSGLRDNLTDTEKRLAQYIDDSIEALQWIKTVAETNYEERYTKATFNDDNTVGVVASGLCDLDFFKTPYDVVYFYNNAYKFVDVANCMDFIKHCKEMITVDPKLTEGNITAIKEWLSQYWTSKGLDFDQQIAELEDDLAFYK